MPLKGKQNVKDAVGAIADRKNDQLRAVFIKGMQNIALGTPVDEGRARNSWYFSAKAPQTSGERSANKSGSSSLRGISTMPKRVFGRKIFYANDMPYINKLEYGGFPDPADNPQKTSGGFSDQAPKGWVRGELLKMRKRIRVI